MTVTVVVIIAKPMALTFSTAFIGLQKGCITAFSFKTDRIISTFGAGKNQARVQGVVLVFFSMTVRPHVCPSAQNLLLTGGDGGVDGHGVGL